MLKRFLFCLAIVAGTAQAAIAVPVINNAGFNVGPSGAQLDGWTLMGYGGTPAPVPGFGTLVPAPGTNAATLYTHAGPYPGGTNPSPNSVTQVQAETALGLAAGAIQTVSDNSGPIVHGSILFQQVTGLTGDQISFDVDFGNEFSDFGNDFSFAVLSDPTGATADQVIRTGTGLGVSFGLPPTLFTFLRDATLTNPLILGFGVVNTSDENEASSHRIGNIVGIAAAPSAAAPEIDPASAATPLAACALALLSLSRRRRLR